MILAARKGQLLKGLLGRLCAIDALLINEPGAVPGETEVRWAGRTTKVLIAPAAGAARDPGQFEPGAVLEGISPRPGYPPARRIASAEEPAPCQVGEVVELGGPIDLRDSAAAARGRRPWLL